MSSRAAVRLEALGFHRVYDYKAGKKDWLAAGLAAEGESSGLVRVGDVARPSPPTCRCEETVDALADRSDVEEWGLCVATDSDNVVHGLITPAVLSTSFPGAIVDEVMVLGPTTVRPSASIDSAQSRMNDAEVDFVLVTTEFGELLGVLSRGAAEEHLAGERAQ